MRRLLTSAGWMLAALMPLPAPAVTVSGQVVDERGLGIFNVDLDWIDLATDLIIFTPFDNTDGGGFYSVDVPLGSYEVIFNAPTGSAFLDRSIKPVDVTGPMTLNTFLYDAMLVTGSVENQLGQPLASIDLNFFDVATGDQYEANNDNSDLSGVFAVFVPGLTWDIYFTPPLGQPYAGQVLFNVAVAGTTSLGTVTLPDGLVFRARVLDPVFQPVQSADTDFLEATTGFEIYSPRDDTDSNGQLETYVPAGTYDFVVNAPPGSGLAWKTVYDVVVAGSVDLGDVQLEPGFAVTGTLRDPGFQPVAGADLDMKIRATGNDLPTPDDNSDGAGQFSLLCPATTFDLWIRPPASANLAGHVLRDVTVSGALNLGNVAVPTGFPISGVVRDVFGDPVPDVDLDATELATGFGHPVVGTGPDASGNYSVRLPGGSWILTATPPPASGLLPVSVTIDPLAAPTVVDFALPSAMVGVELGSLETGVRLLPASPNPFRSSTRVGFELPRAEPDARIAVYDLAGRRVRDLTTGPRTAGRHSIVWNGRDGAGRRVAAGVYLVRLETSSDLFTRKITLLR